jgi:hypothetical protein
MTGSSGRGRLAAWAARATDLDALHARARGAGIALGEVLDGSREAADGGLLTWAMTDPEVVGDDGVLPFFIDWGDTPHPARRAPGGVRLESLRAEHPDPIGVGAALTLLGVSIPVTAGSHPALVATLVTPRGPVELR